MSFWKTQEIKDLRAKHGEKRNYEFYVELVALMDKYHGTTEAGSFPTKAAQKDLLDYLNRAYDYCQIYKEAYKEHKWQNTIYNLCHVREKYREFNDPERFDKAMKLAEIREYYKAMPIVKKAPQKKLAKRTPLAATHKGTCQICFKVHCVSNADQTMVDHGYTISEGRGWYLGHRTGSCYGWRHLPFEKDCTLVKETYQSYCNEFKRMRANRHKQLFRFNKRLQKDVPIENPYDTYERRWLLQDMRKLKDMIKNWKPQDLQEVEFAD